MKNSIDSVISKMPNKKRNFKKHNVNLESVGQLKNQITLIENSNRLAEDLYTKVYEALDEAKRFYVEYNRIYEDSVNLALEIQLKAEDLGVEIPEVSTMDTLLDETWEYITKIDQIANK
tara:strand:- start:1098 stop:1454 length:357 start_codon:yes stop_codon:yes gene_type:complete